MQWWQLWDGASRASHPVSSRGDHEVTWWAGLACLAMLAVGLFFTLKLAFDRPAKSSGVRGCR